MNILSEGDTFSGTASYQDCFEVSDHSSGLLITATQGNGFRGQVVSHVKDQLRSWAVRGFFYIPTRQLIAIPEQYDSNTYSLVCNYDPDTDNDADCKILTDLMSRQCGTIGLRRDRTGKLTSMGSDLYSLFMSIDHFSASSECGRLLQWEHSF